MVLTIVRKIRTLTQFEKPFWVLEAIFLLLASKIILSLFPFKRVTKIMGQLMEESSFENMEGQGKVQTLSDAIKMASKNIPFETACYVEALTAKIMLNRRKLISTLYLGVLKDEEGLTKGHAWLRYGDIIVTGEESHEKYTVIATYC